ncbi:hypothetical protein [Streptomyces sp. NPDC004296]|uniref:hypothetical protein n=1 Tax=Streptomyces sp. NPDC004296 TaxID=3364697 RepID=UPI00368CC0C4
MGGSSRPEVEPAAGFTVVAQEQAGAESGVTAGDPVLVLATWGTSRAIALPDTGKTAVGAMTGGPEE